MRWAGLDEEYNEQDDPSFIGLSSPSQTVSGRESRTPPRTSQPTRLRASIESSSKKRGTPQRQETSSISPRPSGRGRAPSIGLQPSKPQTETDEVGLKIKVSPETKIRFHAWAIQHGTSMTALIKGFINDVLKS